MKRTPGIAAQAALAARAALVALATVALAGCAASSRSNPPAGSATTAAPIERRSLVVERGGEWLGEGIAYGPHRDGQRPGGASPSRAQLAEDLGVIARHWKWIRVYDAADLGDTILRTIHDERLDLHVMLGAWVAVEQSLPDSAGRVKRFPAVRAENRREMAAAIRLANAWPDIVSLVCVGNETQVSWTDHRVAPEVLIGYLREVRAHTRVPVTTADDFNFWNKPESQRVARECDLIVLHGHPLWNGTQVEGALAWTQKTLADIQALHPGVPIVYGEAGWATQRGEAGDQAKYMKGRLGEAEQARFRTEFHEWVVRERVPSFWFEAFDENWKGGSDPAEVEKHWGLYRADRTPKTAMVGEATGR
jgi:exo-beta-1,3-glucanase (GH17 family)